MCASFPFGSDGRMWDLIVVRYKTIFVIISLFTRVCNILMFCKFETAVDLSLRERIYSPREFAPLSILNLFSNELASLRIFCKFVFT